jgi:hypothetical protein
LFLYGTAIALMGLTFFHLNDVKAADEKGLPIIKFKKGSAFKRQNTFFRFDTD